MLTGGSIAVYSKVETKQNICVLIIGIVILMYGTYRVSNTIPGNKNRGADLFIEEEE